MNKILDKLGLASLLALTAVSSFAEGLTFAEQMTNSATEAVEDVATKIAPVLIAAFGITVAFLVYKLIKRAVNKA